MKETGRTQLGATELQGRRTRIICTIGPACRTAEQLEGLISAGMDIARLHFAYADQSEHTENIRRIRAAAEKLNRRVAILQDLSGSKVRMKDFANETEELVAGVEFTLTARAMEGSSTEASLNFPELISVVEAGDTVLLADGALELEAVAVSSADIRCKVIRGGRIKSQQAVHVPGRAAPVPVPTDKDRADVIFGIQQEVNWIAQSFATTAKEIKELQDFIRQQGATTPVIAKIERREALTNLVNIVQAADAVMVARGDLGLEIPLEQIAFVQKRIIACANSAGKPVITATEMLFSMMKKLRPTRAEVTDITNAILDGSDALLLSGETSMGEYPVETTTMMARIAQATDQQIANRIR